MGKLEGKVALVTASTEGIGFAIARKLGLDGASVIICSRKRHNVDKAVALLKSENINVLGFQCHVGKTSDRKFLFDKVKEVYGGLDILVPNAAVNPYFGNILSTPESIYDKIFDINVKSTFMLIQEFIPLMKLRNKGSIVMVSSTAGFIPNQFLGIYSVTKTALIGLTKALTNELASMNIRVNCLAPGIIKTKFSEALYKQGEEAVAQTIPVQRLGVPDDCSGIVSFLCSDEASYITGETVVVGGGMHCRL